MRSNEARLQDAAFSMLIMFRLCYRRLYSTEYSKSGAGQPYSIYVTAGLIPNLNRRQANKMFQGWLVVILGS
jgi:hypothetical protein